MHAGRGLRVERSLRSQWMHVSRGLHAERRYNALDGCTTAVGSVLSVTYALNGCTSAAGCVRAPRQRGCLAHSALLGIPSHSARFGTRGLTPRLRRVDRLLRRI